MAIATDYSTVRKTNLYLGAATLAVGCAMAFEFGRSMSYLHALSLCCLSIAVAFLPSVVQARAPGWFRVHVMFNDGSENTIDFAECAADVTEGGLEWARS